MDWLQERTAKSPKKAALIIGEQRWTFAALEQMVNSVCVHLQNVGVKPGDFVGVLLPNCLEYVCLIHALARLGAVLVPLNTRLTEAELAWQIKHVGCKLVLTTEERGNKWSMVNGQWSMVNETWLTGDLSFTIHNSQFTIHD